MLLVLVLWLGCCTECSAVVFSNLALSGRGLFVCQQEAKAPEISGGFHHFLHRSQLHSTTCPCNLSSLSL